jgi:hypothetical protein
MNDPRHNLQFEGLPNTVRVLLAGCRARPSDADLAMVRTLASGSVEWAWLLELALRHGVGALLYQSLHAAGGAPEDMLERLRAAVQAQTQHALRQTGELLAIAGDFGQAAIPLLALKGPALAALAYGNLAFRSSVDLDILVRRADLPRAMRAFERRGYHLVEQLALAQTSAYQRAQHHYSFVRGEHLVELHYELRERCFGYPLHTDALWGRAAPVQLAGGTLLAPCHADQLVSLCMHGAGHSWERLGWICDIAELLRLPHTLDWEALLNGMRVQGAERMLLLGLSLAHTLLDAPLPAIVLERITGDRAVSRLVAAVCRRLFAPRSAERNLLETARFYTATRERQRDRLSYCARLLFTPTMGDWKMVALPERLSFLYYGLRPLRLLGTYWGARRRHAEV